MRQQYLMSQGSPPRMKIARLFPAEYPWFFETHHKYLLGFGEHRSKKWLLPSSLLDSQAISVRRVQPTTHECFSNERRDDKLSLHGPRTPGKTMSGAGMRRHGSKLMTSSGVPSGPSI